MIAWDSPEIPELPGTGPIPQLFDQSSGELRAAADGDSARLYVCGITPYDATHIGHANTYLAYDTLTRVWLDANLQVSTAQNSTDVDDPLLERAARDDIDWQELAASQHALFRDDMQALRVRAPDSWIAVTERITEAADAVKTLLDKGLAYSVTTDDSSFDDIYADARAVPGWTLGVQSRTSESEMEEFSAERGGDPERSGKRDPLDPLLWRAARDGEPQWTTVLGDGRPGWHIECAVIALGALGAPITVSGGGSDLVFPHHEFTAQHAEALTGSQFARIRSNSGMVGFEGEKMSKSKGNLVRVSELLQAGVRPAAIRLAILAHHYREDWEWTDEVLRTANERLDRWSEWAKLEIEDPSRSDTVLDWLRLVLQDDLNTPAALQAVDRHIARVPVDEVSLAAIDALLGIRLEPFQSAS